MNAPFRSSIIGQSITRIMRTPWSSPVTLIEGLGPAVHCDIIFELESQERFSVFYGDVNVSTTQADQLEFLEADLRPAGPFGKIWTLAVDQWEGLYVLLEDGNYLQVDSGGACGRACRVEGGLIDNLRMVDDIPMEFRDYWTGDIIEIHARKSV